MEPPPHTYTYTNIYIYTCAYIYIYIYIYGHVYFVLHQKRTIPRKGFEIGFCKEGWHDFHGGDLSVVVRKGSYVEGIGLCHISIGRVDGGW